MHMGIEVLLTMALPWICVGGRELLMFGQARRLKVVVRWLLDASHGLGAT